MTISYIRSRPAFSKPFATFHAPKLKCDLAQRIDRQLFLLNDKSRLFPRPFQTLDNKTSLKTVKVHSLPDEKESPQQDSTSFVAISITFYSAMTAAATILGRKYHILDQLKSPLQLQPALISLGFMSILFVASTALAEVNPSFKNLKEIYQKTLIPQLRPVPVWGLALISIGAGVGEETAFRALIQTSLIQYLIDHQLHLSIPNGATIIGIFISSILFGAAHAVTASYFIFATIAGVVFGIEYLQGGLPAAAFTHALYDFIAFIAILQLWDTEKERKKIDD